LEIAAEVIDSRYRVRGKTIGDRIRTVNNFTLVNGWKTPWMLIGEIGKHGPGRRSDYVIIECKKHAEYHEKNISLFELNGKIMGKKTIKEKPPLELQFDHVKDKITGWEKYRNAHSQIGPWIMLLSGALMATVGLFSAILGGRTTMGISVGIIGILIIIAAWIWSRKRSKGQRDVEEKILTMKGDLALLEKER
jgi:hypothetical protein